MQPRRIQQGTGQEGSKIAMMHLMLMRGCSLCTSTAEPHATYSDARPHGHAQGKHAK